jgi:hypothetical protein
MKHLLEMTFGEKIRKNDVFCVYSSISASASGRQLAWDFLKSRFGVSSQFFSCLPFIHTHTLLFFLLTPFLIFVCFSHKKSLSFWYPAWMILIGLTICFDFTVMPSSFLLASSGL